MEEAENGSMFSSRKPGRPSVGRAEAPVAARTIALIMPSKSLGMRTQAGCPLGFVTQCLW